MARGRLRVREAPPGPGPLRDEMQAFARAPGTVTALHDARLRLLRALQPEGSDVEVALLGDLYGRWHTAAGESCLPIATHGQVHAAICLACGEEPEDSPMAAAGRFAGLHDRLARALGELRDWGLRAEALDDLANRAEDDLSVKLRALARIERRVTELLERVGREFAAERVQRLVAGANPRGKPFDRLLVIAEAEAPKVVADWLRWLAEQGVLVDVWVEHLANEAGLFAGGERWRRALDLKAAAMDRESPSGMDGPWFEALFSERVAQPGASADVSILQAADPLAESEWALRGCLERMIRGVPPHRLAIVARDEEAYAPLLAASAHRLGVPLHATRNVHLLTNGFAAWVLSLLEALSSRDVRTLGRVARSSYVRLDRAEQMTLVGKLRAAHASPESWTALAQASDNAPEWLYQVLEWRREAVAEPRTLMAWHGRLRRLLESPQLHQRVLDRSSPTYHRDQRAHTAMMRPLAEAAPLVALLDERPFGLGTFAGVCRDTWAHEETVTPAEHVDGVRMVTAPEVLEPMDAVWVLGMLEGVMPRRRVEDPVLSDADRAWVSEVARLAVPLPNSQQRAREERDAFVRLCAAAPRLTFSYPLTDDNRDNVPAFYLSELERVLEGRVLRIDRPRRELAPEPDDCRSPSDLTLRLAMDAPREDAVQPELASAEAKSRLRPRFEEGVTPSEFADGLRCRFLVGWAHRIGLAPARERAWGTLTRLPLRARLPLASDPQTARAALQVELAQLEDELAPEASEVDLRLLRATGERLIEGWVEREFAARKLWPRYEVVDGKSATNVLRREIKVAGRTIRFVGTPAAISQREASRVLHLFCATVGEAARWDEDAELVFELQLWLMMALANEGAEALELDGQNGVRRLLFVAEDGADIPSQHVQSGLHRTRWPRDGKRFYRGASDLLREAIGRMDPPSFRPDPGESCESCDLGEMCRFSRDFGEAISLFEGDAFD